MDKLKIVIVGYGAMGKILDAISAENDVEVVAICSPSTPGCFTDLESIKDPFDVIIDFSTPSSLSKTLQYIKSYNKPLVLATTGFTPEQVNDIHETSTYAPIFYTQNMSLGINVLEEVLRRITPILKDDFDIEIVESHHKFKVDAPSGTAIMLADAIDSEGEFERVYGREGMSKRVGKQIGMHAIRGGTIVGEHSVIFAGTDEIIEIKHTALSKKVFAVGAIKAAKFLKNATSGLYNMTDIL